MHLMRPLPLLFILIWLANGPALALPDQSRGDLPLAGRAIVFGGTAPIPIGYYDLCRKGHPVCRLLRGRIARTSDGAVRLNANLLGQLRSTNGEVNRSIRPQRDAFWRVGPEAGDCKDYALTKKYRLMSHGWPSSALLIATAFTSGGEEHAVLIARTDRGDFVLDNLALDVRLWSPSLYDWEAIQSPTDQWTWRNIKGSTTRLTSLAEERAD